MAIDAPSSSQLQTTRGYDATLRMDVFDTEDTFLLGEHSYDNFLDGLDDDASFAVPGFSQRMSSRISSTPVAGKPIIRARPEPSRLSEVSLPIPPLVTQMGNGHDGIV